jgi:general secretion pathway protein M
MPLPKWSLPQPGTPVSRLAAGALVALAAAALLTPLLGLRADLVEETERAQRQFEHQQRLLERRPALERQRDALKAAGSPDFLQGVTPALAGADLQSKMTDLATARGARVQSTQVMEEREAEDGFRRIAVQVRVAADPRALRDLLHAVESGRPRLLVDGLAVRSLAFGTEQMDVTFTVIGFLESAS